MDSMTWNDELQKSLNKEFGVSDVEQQEYAIIIKLRNGCVVNHYKSGKYFLYGNSTEEMNRVKKFLFNKPANKSQA